MVLLACENPLDPPFVAPGSLLHILQDFSVVLIQSRVIAVAFRKIAKSDNQLRRVCPSAWNNSAPTAWIFMKFDV
jgi:hypothetical protein